MWRFLSGAGAALLLCGAGVVLWTSGSAESDPIKQAARPLKGEAPSEPADAKTPPPPAATERTREEKRFDRYDKDRNQGISADEYLLSRRKAYAKLDANRDGQLSFDEWAKKTTDKFAKADADKSRILSRTEFATTRVVRKSPARRDCPPPPRAEADDEG